MWNGPDVLLPDIHEGRELNRDQAAEFSSRDQFTVIAALACISKPLVPYDFILWIQRRTHVDHESDHALSKQNVRE